MATFAEMFGTVDNTAEDETTIPLDSSSSSAFRQSAEAGINAGEIKSTAGNLALLNDLRLQEAETRKNARSAYSASSNVLGAIDRLQSPNDDVFGAFGTTKADAAFGRSGRAPWLSTFLSTSANEANSDLQLIKSQVFLDAYENLKGGGHISNAEGDKAIAARTTLASDPPPSDRDAARALEELRVINQAIKDRNDPNNPMRFLENGELVPLSVYLERTTQGTEFGTSQPAPETNPDVEPIDLSDATGESIRQQWEAAPSGTVFIRNGTRKVKP